MKIAKSFVASILSFALIFTLYVKPTAAAYNSVQPSFSTQQEESYSFLLYRDMSMPLMSDISSKQIAEKYSTQLATITGNSQRICGQITWETLEQIKAYIKCHNSLDNSFYSLLSDIAIAATEQKLALVENDIIKECLGEYSNTRDYGGFEIRNKTVTNLISLKPLKGNITLPDLQWENANKGVCRHGLIELPSLLPQMQKRNPNRRNTTENNVEQRARCMTQSQLPRKTVELARFFIWSFYKSVLRVFRNANRNDCTTGINAAASSSVQSAISRHSASC